MASVCVSCGTSLGAEDRFCGVCGTPSSATTLDEHSAAAPPSEAAAPAITCLVCNADLGAEDRFCGVCGAPAASRQAAEESARAERKSPSEHVRAAAPLPRKNTRRPPWARKRVLALLGVAVLGAIAGVGAGFALTEFAGLGDSGGDGNTSIPPAAQSVVATTSTSFATTTFPATVVSTTSTTLAATTTAQATSTTVFGDLGLEIPMAKPECDGSYATFIGASVDSSRYAIEIADYLAEYPAANYLRTDITCSSLRPQTDAGETIYAVFFGPFSTLQEACEAAENGPSGSYPKPLDSTSDPTVIPNC